MINVEELIHHLTQYGEVFSKEEAADFEKLLNSYKVNDKINYYHLTKIITSSYKNFSN